MQTTEWKHDATGVATGLDPDSVIPGTLEGRHIALRVVGDSFAPKLRAGDVVLVRVGAVPPNANFVLALDASRRYAIRRRGTERTGDDVLGAIVLRWLAQPARR